MRMVLKNELAFSFLCHYENRKNATLVTCNIIGPENSCYLYRENFRWRSALLWRTFFTTAVVAIVLRGFIQYCTTGNCGLFGEGGLIMYDVSAAGATYSGPDILAVLFLGTVGGILGSIYNYLVDKVIRTYSIIHEYVLLPNRDY